jgi:hypothetical protein
MPRRTGTPETASTPAERARLVALIARDGLDAVAARTGRSKRALSELVAREKRRAEKGATS